MLEEYTMSKKFISINQITRIEYGITSHCNAGCPVCARHYLGTSTVRPEMTLGHISLEQFIKNSESLGDHIANVTLSLGGVYGDPIVHPDILSIVSYAVKHYKKTYIDTNGGVRNSNFWKQLGELSCQHKDKLEVKFSIDGLADTNPLYRINTRFDMVINNAKTYIAQGGYASWKYIVFKHNEHQIEQAESLAAELGFKKFRKIYTRRFKNGTQAVISSAYSSKINQVSEEVRTNGFVLEPSSLVTLDEIRGNHDGIISEVNCKSIEEGYLYVCHENKLWPCCFFDGARFFDDNFIKYWSTVECKFGKDFNSLDNTGIDKFLEHPYFSDYLPDGWTNNAPNCNECFAVCGKKQYRKSINLVNDIQ